MDLKELLGDLFTKEIEEKVGDKKVYIAESGNDYIPKSRFDDVNTKLKEQKALFDEQSKKMEELSKSQSNADDLKAQIEKIKNEHNAKLSEMQSKYDEQAFSNSFMKESGKYHFKEKFSKQVLNQIDRTKLTKDDEGNYKGFDEQLSKIVEEYPEYVESASGGRGGSQIGGNDTHSLEQENAMRKAMGLPPKTI